MNVFHPRRLHSRLPVVSRWSYYSNSGRFESQHQILALWGRRTHSSVGRHHNADTRTAAREELKTKSATTTSLNKWLAHQGLCSRREADAWIARGWVRINGHVVTEMPVFVKPDDHVQVHQQAQEVNATNATIILHKPLGIVSSQPENGHTPAIQLLTADRHFVRRNDNKNTIPYHRDPFRQRGWKVAGRLDINSTGLLVLTQSGVVAQQIVSPRPGVELLEKEYLVRAATADSSDVPGRIKALQQHGAMDNGDLLQAERIEQINPDQLRIVLKAGKHHHIRRMLRSVNLPVRAIKRVRIGNIVLADLPLGHWRYLGPHETF